MGLCMIHTGDLHIGQNLHRISRLNEHRAMLAWLHQQLLQQQAHLLLISGDIFDYSLPTAKAQRVFYEFLGGLESIPSLRTVIITAGNHDSAHLLQAISPVMKRIGIHVIGADKNRNAEWKNWLVPVIGASGQYEAVVAAVPFVHEFRLGIRMNSGSKLQHADSIRNALRDLYDQMAEWATQEFPGLPLLGMGHLTAVSSEQTLGICPQQIHIALENGIDGRIFSPQYSYIALGHIHKNYRIRGDSNAYYCGSPLPCSIDEAEDGSTRGVWKVVLNGTPGEKPKPQLLPIPCYRQLIRLRGIVDELEQQVRDLEWPAEQEPPMLWLIVETSQSRFDLQPYFQDVVAELPLEQRPYVVKIDNVVINPELEAEPVASTEELGLLPEDVFRKLLQLKGESVEDTQLMSLFMQTYQEVRQDSQDNSGVEV